MNISIIGTGYVGLVTGVCLADKGHIVYCVDIDEEKVNKLIHGILPIYEPGLKELLLNNIENERLKFTTDLKTAIEKTDVCYIAVGTPMSESKQADLKYVFKVATDIGKYMDKFMYVVDKSTVPVGTSKLIKDIINNELKKRNLNLDFHIISNPEFLREGTAVKDFLEPDRVIVGVENYDDEEVMRNIYKNIVKSDESNLIIMDVPSAEMTKYVANAFLATKISFINEMANICERVGANINMVRKGIGTDHRIGKYFINPGCGYGGSCFPKDVEALINISINKEYEPSILKAVEKVNKEQKKVLVKKVCKKFGEDLSKVRIGLWGLAFKPNTDDTREASSIVIINELINKGCEVLAYDPQASENIKIYINDNPKVKYVDNKYAAIEDADALILVTEWEEFKDIDIELMKKLMKKNIIFDGRNQFDVNKMKESGFEYQGIGIGENNI